MGLIDIFIRQTTGKVKTIVTNFILSLFKVCALSGSHYDKEANM